MPYEVKARGSRQEIISWLQDNVGKFKVNTHLWSCCGDGWELLPLGIDYNNSIFVEPTLYIIRIWNKDMTLLAKLRWE